MGVSLLYFPGKYFPPILSDLHRGQSTIQLFYLPTTYRAVKYNRTTKLLQPLGDKLRPHLALALPVRHRSDGAHICFTDRITSLYRSGQEQKLLLDIWCQVAKVHDLGDPGPGHVAEPCQIGIVPQLTALDQAFEPDRKGHQLGETGYVPGFDLSAVVTARVRLLFAVFWLEDEGDLHRARSGSIGWYWFHGNSFLLHLPGLAAQRFDARRVECDGNPSIPSVVSDALDEEPDDPGLFPRRQGFPDRVKGTQGISQVIFVHGLPLNRDEFFTDCGHPLFQCADPVLQVRQLVEGRLLGGAF